MLANLGWEIYTGIDLSLDNDYFNLHENILISNRIYSIVSFRENLLKSDIIYKEIGYETGIEKYEQEVVNAKEIAKQIILRNLNVRIILFCNGLYTVRP